MSSHQRVALRVLFLLLLFALLAGACRQPPPPPTPTPTPAATPTATPIPRETPVPVVLPKDDAPHPGYNTEWWYYNGYLRSKDGQEFGFHMVVFDVRVPGTGNFNIYHAAVTDYQKKEFLTAQHSLSQPTPGPGGAGAPYPEWHFNYEANPDWMVRGGAGRDRLKAPVSGYAFDLQLKEAKPPALHGGIGWLDFFPNPSTYYYSRTRMDVSGSLKVQGQALEVTGSAWFDHQWGNFRIQQGGWDWFAIQLDDGNDLMLFQLRDAAGKPSHAFGTVIDRAGSGQHLGGSAIQLSATGSWTSPPSGGAYPMGWRLAIPAAGIDLTIEPVIPHAEFDATATTFNRYWEGPARVTGSHTGRAFVELVGYAPFRVPGR